MKLLKAKQLSYLIFDKGRNRIIPLTIYENEAKKCQRVTIINHGYGVKNTEYSFFAKGLAARGYYVVSIQHDLANDVPLAKTNNLFERRKPLWRRGVQNLLFTISELKKKNPTLNLKKVILIGHSNGGDISMMFTDEYPKMVERLEWINFKNISKSLTMGIWIFQAIKDRTMG